jgi:hypothetical protein
LRPGERVEGQAAEAQRAQFHEVAAGDGFLHC